MTSFPVRRFTSPWAQHAAPLRLRLHLHHGTANAYAAATPDADTATASTSTPTSHRHAYPHTARTMPPVGAVGRASSWRAWSGTPIAAFFATFTLGAARCAPTPVLSIGPVVAPPRRHVSMDGDTAPTGLPWHQRRSTRLPGHDYRSAGAYLVTICTMGRQTVLADVVGPHVLLSDLGRIVVEVLLTLPSHHTHVRVDAYAMLPNHVHGIFVLAPAATVDPATDAARSRPAVVPGSLGAVIRSMKAETARRAGDRRGVERLPLWQRGYHDRIIRDDAGLERVRRYLADNPARWAAP